MTMLVTYVVGVLFAVTTGQSRFGELWPPEQPLRAAHGTMSR
ncbi:hypothetical protein [Actinophytocola oryzae]|nr:hypothetical protein [Actinophytocola oryzae]